MLMAGRTRYHKDVSSSPKLIYKLNANPKKFSGAFILGFDKLTLNFKSIAKGQE